MISEGKFHIVSPCVKSFPLSRRLETDIYLKLDNFQPTNSFKVRGIGNVCYKSVTQRGVKYLVASSGGNAGYAVAYCARILGVPATVVIPNTTVSFMREKISGEGAIVVVHGNTWAEANEKAKEIVSQTPFSELIPPFDHPDIWEGHTSIVEELHEQLPKKPDAIICVVGGGGLLCGLAKGLDKVGWGDVPIIATETEGSTKLKESLRTGTVVKIDKISTIAKALGVSYVTKEVLELNTQIIPTIVSDRDTVNAIVQMSNDHHMLLEPSCAAGVSLLYNEDKSVIEPFLGPDKLIVVIICGGNMVNLTLVNDWIETFLAG